jgi:hypothetical protein
MTSLLVVIDAKELRELIADAVSAALADRGAEPGAPALLDRVSLARALDIGCTTLDGLRREPDFPQVMVGDSPRFQLAEVIDWCRARQQAEQARGGRTKPTRKKRRSRAKGEGSCTEQSASSDETPVSAGNHASSKLGTRAA